MSIARIYSVHCKLNSSWQEISGEYEAGVIRFKNKEFFFVIKWLGNYSTKKITNLYYGPNRVSKDISKKYKDKKLTELKEIDEPISWKFQHSSISVW